MFTRSKSVAMHGRDDSGDSQDGDLSDYNSPYGYVSSPVSGVILQGNIAHSKLRGRLKKSSVTTSRPFTPAEDNRVTSTSQLFGHHSNHHAHHHYKHRPRQHHEGEQKTRDSVYTKDESIGRVLNKEHSGRRKWVENLPDDQATETSEDFSTIRPARSIALSRSSNTKKNDDEDYGGLYDSDETMGGDDEKSGTDASAPNGTCRTLSSSLSLPFRDVPSIVLLLSDAVERLDHSTVGTLKRVTALLGINNVADGDQRLYEVSPPASPQFKTRHEGDVVSPSGSDTQWVRVCELLMVILNGEGGAGVDFSHSMSQERDYGEEYDDDAKSCFESPGRCSETKDSMSDIDARAECQLLAATLVLRISSEIASGAVGGVSLYRVAACRVLFNISRAAQSNPLRESAGAITALVVTLSNGPTDINHVCSCGTSDNHSSRPIVSSTSARHLHGRLQPILSSLVFAAGCVRNLSSAGEEGQKRLSSTATARHLTALIRCGRNLHDEISNVSVDKSDASNMSKLSDQLVALMIQSLGTLRNICQCEASRNQLLSYEGDNGEDGVGIVCGLLSQKRSWALGRPALTLEVARVIAKLSLHERARHAISADPNNLRDMLNALVVLGELATPRDHRTQPSKSHVDDVALCEYIQRHSATLVRLSFALGNLTATNDSNRLLVGIRFGGAAMLPSLLQQCGVAWNTVLNLLAKDEAGADDSSSSGGEASHSIKSVLSSPVMSRKCCADLEDLVIKLARLCAHVAINRASGAEMARQKELTIVVPLLRRAVKAALFTPEHKGNTSSSSNYELLLNLVSLTTNLTFYGGTNGDLDTGTSPRPLRTPRGQEESPVLLELAAATSKPYYNNKSESKENDSCYSNGGMDEGEESETDGADTGLDLCSLLVRSLLVTDCLDVVAEAARALGNCSRSSRARDSMGTVACETLVLLLNHPERYVAHAVLGPITNLAADGKHRPNLRIPRLETGQSLCRLLRSSGLKDPEVSTLCCMATCNLLLDPLPSGGVAEALGGDSVLHLLRSTLQEVVSVAQSSLEERCNDTSDSDDKSRSTMHTSTGLRGSGASNGVRSSDAINAGYTSLIDAGTAVLRSISRQESNYDDLDS